MASVTFFKGILRALNLSSNKNRFFIPVSALEANSIETNPFTILLKLLVHDSPTELESFLVLLENCSNCSETFPKPVFSSFKSTPICTSKSAAIILPNF